MFWGPLLLAIYNQNVNLLPQTGENLGWKMNINDRTSENLELEGGLDS